MEDERFYTKDQLQFSVLEAEALLTTSNSIEVKLLIQNTSEKGWPLGVRIRGKDCDITCGVDISLEKRLKSSSIIGVKFSFNARSDIVCRTTIEALGFEFVATDRVKNIKYWSKPLTIPLTIRKSSKFNVSFNPI